MPAIEWAAVGHCQRYGVQAAGGGIAKLGKLLDEVLERRTGKRREMRIDHELVTEGDDLLFREILLEEAAHARMQLRKGRPPGDALEELVTAHIASGAIGSLRSRLAA
jgi:hypothetical protein